MLSFHGLLSFELLWYAAQKADGAGRAHHQEFLSLYDPHVRVPGRHLRFEAGKRSVRHLSMVLRSERCLFISSGPVRISIHILTLGPISVDIALSQVHNFASSGQRPAAVLWSNYA